MFERFDDGSRAAIERGYDFAAQQGARSLTVGHLLYGCAAGSERTAAEPLHECGITGAVVRRLLTAQQPPQGRDLDAETLGAIGIDYEEVRQAVEQTFGAGALESAPDRRVATKTRGRPRMTPEAKKSLELALRVVRELHQDRIRPEHLLLGLIRLDD